MLKLTDLTMQGMYNLIKSYNKYVEEICNTYEDKQPVSIYEFLNNEGYEEAEIAEGYLIIDTTDEDIICTHYNGQPMIFDTLEEAREYAFENVQEFQIVPMS